MEDYKSSALRHFSSAQVLKDAQELDNSGHLLGIAAECAIKHKCALVHSDFDSGKGHLPRLLNVAKRKLNQNQDRGFYSLLDSKIFSNWNINDRYATSGKVTQANLEEWLSNTKQIFKYTGIKKPK